MKERGGSAEESKRSSRLKEDPQHLVDSVHVIKSVESQAKPDDGSVWYRWVFTLIFFLICSVSLVAGSRCTLPAGGCETPKTNAHTRTHTHAHAHTHAMKMGHFMHLLHSSLHCFFPSSFRLWAEPQDSEAIRPFCFPTGGRKLKTLGE